MLAINGIYENGLVKLEKEILLKKSARVIVTFLEDDILSDPKTLALSDFSFKKSREESKRYKGSISDAVIEERKKGL